VPKDTKREFRNPLLQPTEAVVQPPENITTATEPAPETATATSTQAITEVSTEPTTYTSTYEPRKRGKEAFERTHQRITLWADKQLYRQFKAVAKRHDLAQSTLLDEAIRDLLAKYGEH
jgi:hypothetical protein